MRLAAHVADNQAKVVSALRQCGASVHVLSPVGRGVPDLLVGWRGRNLLLEVKDGAKRPSARRLTDDQVEWHEGWRGQRAIVESIDDALRVLNATR